jgi:hypothetical protein
MSNALTPGLQITPRTVLRKRRDLPAKGRVLVKGGDLVGPETVVAQTLREGELRLVRVAEKLNVPPVDALAHLAVKQGDRVVAGQVIAELRGLWGLFRTTVEAPIAGEIEMISAATGHVGIRAAPTTIQLRAYMGGTIVQLDDERGVTIENEVAFVQGIFGVGGERIGTIRILPECAERPVQESDIPMICKGDILVGGYSPSIAALQSAADRGAVGFVTGSIDDRTLSSYVGYDIGIALTGDEPVPMTLIITEGFGAIPIDRRITEVLRAADGASASINGATQVRAGALRPEIITRALSAVECEAATSSSARSLRLGSLVRLIRVPYFGLRGVIVDLPHDLVQIETGAWARVAKVRLNESQKEVVVPRANIEVVST